MLRIFLQITFFLSLLIPGLSLADEPADFGGVAMDMMEPLGILTDFLNTASIIIGASFLFAALIKYFQYRTNPFAVPISNVVFLLILGIMLIFLPLAYKLSYDVPPYLVVDKKE